MLCRDTSRSFTILGFGGQRTFRLRESETRQQLPTVCRGCTVSQAVFKQIYEELDFVRPEDLKLYKANKSHIHT